MSNVDILEGFSWHSAIGIDCALDGKRFVTRVPNTRRAAGMFESAGNDLLIHKTTKCLWKLSENGKFIEPVFSNDILSDDDVTEAMKET